MPDLAVDGLDVVTDDRLAIAQVRIVLAMPGLPGLGERRLLALAFGAVDAVDAVDAVAGKTGPQRVRIEALAPQAPAAPVNRVAVVAQVVALLLARHRPIGVDARAVADLCLGDGHRQRAAGPVGLVDGDRRDQHLAAVPPGPRLDHQVADGPGIVVEVEVLDLSNRTIGGCDAEVFQVFQAAQHGGSSGLSCRPRSAAGRSRESERRRGTGPGRSGRWALLMQAPGQCRGQPLVVCALPNPRQWRCARQRWHTRVVGRQDQPAT